ncbi:MAG: glycosyltransferase [Candidatus Eremiobacteraeota bacterium]|nr:glycosyltransferase [Candidatus Eremiobacteraeota bacterium]
MIRLLWNEADYREESTALRNLVLPEDVLLVGVDLNVPQEAAAEIVRARRQGRFVAVCPTLADPLEGLIAQIATSISEHPDPDQRFLQLAGLRDDRLTIQGKRPGELASLSQSAKNAVNLILKLSDILLFSTPRERERWSRLLGKQISRFAYLPTFTSPRLESRETEGISVYAPSTPRTALRLVDLALAARGLSADFISAENPDAPVAGRVVICAEWWRPQRAISLCAPSRRLIVPLTSGAEERIVCTTYDPANAFSLGAAIDEAWSAPGGAPVYSVSAVSLSEAIERERPRQAVGPLVSIVVRTYDRPILLARAIRSIARQTHALVEIVVVNNGGPDVRAVVEAAVGARPFQYVTSSARAPISAASNLGVRAVKGEYVGYLDDDDLLYPDHIARTLAGLLSSGADLAYSNCVGEYAQMRGETKTVLGVQVYLDRDFNRDEILIGNVAPIHSILHRRDVFERFGYFDEELPVTDDWEMWIRVARGGKVIHVDRATCEYSWRDDPARGNMTITHQQHFVDAYQVIAARYASQTENRSYLKTLQQQSLAFQRARLARFVESPKDAGARTLAEMTATAVPVGALSEDGL